MLFWLNPKQRQKAREEGTAVHLETSYAVCGFNRNVYFTWLTYFGLTGFGIGGCFASFAGVAAERNF